MSCGQLPLNALRNAKVKLRLFPPASTQTKLLRFHAALPGYVMERLGGCAADPTEKNPLMRSRW